MKSVRDVLRGNLLVFTLGDIIRQLSIFITFPYFSLYVQVLGGGSVEIGQVNSVYPLAAFFVYPIAGYIADRHSRAKIIAVASFIMPLLSLISMLAPDWRFLALGNFISGLMVFQFPAMNSLMADSLPPRQLGVGYSLWIAIPSAVGIISPYMGGYLITIMGIEKAMRLLYGLVVISGSGIAMMNLKFLRETRIERSVGTTGKGFLRIIADSYQDMYNALKSLPRSLKAFTLILIINFFINNLVTPYWIVYGVSEIGLSELQWGTILLMTSIFTVASLIPAGMIVDRYDVKKILYLASASLVVPIFLFPFSKSFAEIAVLFIVGSIANAFLTSSAPVFMAYSVPPESRGRVMAALGQGMLFVNLRGGLGGPGMGAVLTIPSILGSVLGGYVYSYNPTLLWILFALSLVVNTIISMVFLSSMADKGQRSKIG